MQIQVDKYSSVQLSDRGERGFALIEGWVNRDGEWKPNFCKREMGKPKTEKTVPVSVKLGDRAKAIEVALAILRSLTGRDYSPVEHKTQEEVPF